METKDNIIKALQIGSCVPVSLSFDPPTGHLIIDGAVSWCLNSDRTRLNIFSGEVPDLTNHVRVVVPLHCRFQQITQCGNHHLEVLDHRVLDHEHLNIRIGDVPWGNKSPPSFSMPPKLKDNDVSTYQWIKVVIVGCGSIDGGRNCVDEADFRVDGRGYISNFGVITYGTLLSLGTPRGGVIAVRALASTSIQHKSDSDIYVQIVDHF